MTELRDAPRLRDALVLLVTFFLGIAVGTDWTRTECTKAKCAIPCGLKQVEVDRRADDWRDWACRCTWENP